MARTAYQHHRSIIVVLLLVQNGHKARGPDERRSRNRSAVLRLARSTLGCNPAAPRRTLGGRGANQRAVLRARGGSALASVRSTRPYNLVCDTTLVHMACRSWLISAIAADTEADSMSYTDRHGQAGKRAGRQMTDKLLWPCLAHAWNHTWSAPARLGTEYSTAVVSICGHVGLVRAGRRPCRPWRLVGPIHPEVREDTPGQPSRTGG